MASLPELPAYAELHCVSNFTFLRGASHPEELIGRAAALGYSALALTDECSLAGVVRAHVAAKEHGLKLIVGTEFALENGLKVVLLATDRRSYGAIAALITAGRRRGRKGTYALSRTDLAMLGGCEVLVLFVAPHDAGPASRAGMTEQARWIAAQFPRRGFGRGDFVHTHPLGFALHVNLAEVNTLEDGRDEAMGVLRDQQGHGARGGLHARGEVDRVAHRGVLVLEIAAHLAHDDRAGVQPHAHGKVNAVFKRFLSVRRAVVADQNVVEHISLQCACPKESPLVMFIMRDLQYLGK